jgi:septum formation protein
MTRLVNAWKYSSPLVLASASHMRAHILKQAGITPEVIPAHINERAIEDTLQGAEPEVIAMTLAEMKACKISQNMHGRMVLGVDQVLIFNHQILSKSVSREAGLTKIRMMAGKPHYLYSCAALVLNGEIVASAAGKVELQMRIFSDDFLLWYEENCKDALLTSVGGYKFEEAGPHLFESIQGDYFTLLGIPLMALLTEFRRLGLIIT